MHEFSTAQAIVKSVLERAKERNARRLLEVEVEIGGLTLLNPEQVEFWIKLGLERTIGNNARLAVRTIEPQISCKVCGYEGEIKVEGDLLLHVPFYSLCCPECSSGEIVVKKGRECCVKRIKVSC
ncbi:MAG TPA: hydrogenase maturation nickel metallochaperone HypA [Candidatus Latescibacteria bacterium]|nr:hydrogenase maturation nickel metallochaperone HypA [Candidatus Latescibacterota bacterium]